MSDKEFYNAQEATSRLATVGIPSSTFYRWVRKGLLTKELPLGRVRGALYSKDQIEKLMERHLVSDTHETKTETPNNKAQTDWIQDGDIPYVMALEWETYGPEFTADVRVSKEWWKKNPFMCRILFDAMDRRHVWGALTIMPLKEEVILRILRKEMADEDITKNDILVYEPGKEYMGYVGATIIRPEYRNHFRRLIKDTLDFWIDQYPQIKLAKLYAYAASEEGLGLIKHLYFSPRYDLSDNAYELDLYKFNPSWLIQAFQHGINEKEER